ncbi:1-aminocyclopropane-1-carboxylate deaminase/D-cysteine desulfhydrase [Thalassotalea atypica]|uniref:1-aminocyclopropane-1-carboxylate deaminase/D-cysteine desulfhydrase n=1 Tax=Thalassotalea atypica TaxID=2054316 RepID=UPI00257453A4|nr:pyridoxal-phosphate dependent enzyme [Thalassotalea atypica]
MTLPSRLEQIDCSLFKKHRVNVFIKRDDLIHPIISGNKWRKLKGNLAEAKRQNKKGIVSFGGAYSNHIHALAYACHQHKLSSIGIIRGESQYQDNFTLSWARYWQMQFKFVDRKTYRKRHEKDYLAELAIMYPDHFVVPEGGTNSFALSGVGEVISELNQQLDYDTIMLPVGSGGTISGLIKADHDQHEILGVAVLKQNGYLLDEITQLLPNTAHHYGNWRLLEDFHCGGYAKFSAQHCQRIIEFIDESQIPFEPVYSGKMLLALLDLVEAEYFPENHTIVLLHTGGLQGLGGLAERKLIKATQWLVPSGPPAR